MLHNPAGSLKDCAADLKRHPVTIRLIARSDLFKAYLEERRKEFEVKNDAVLVAKMQKLAEGSLDMLLETLEKKRDTVPIAILASTTFGVLDRLGYAANAPGGGVVVNNNVAAVAAPPVTASALEEARQALRLAEDRRRGDPLLSMKPAVVLDNEKEAGTPVTEKSLGIRADSEDEDAPLTISSE